uniref:PPIase cyclophilin-type domain-containing protein n=1 Tax=Bos indicus x Bos taurus TaxID=30522 RepID=A0A4W2F272_BOBOX
MSVTLHTDVGDIKIEVFCERTPKTSEVLEGEVTVSGARSLKKNIMNILSTVLEVLYLWLIMAQIPMDLSFHHLWEAATSGHEIHSIWQGDRWSGDSR